MRSHTVSAEGGAAGVFEQDDSLDEHAYDTISGGDWLTDQDAVEAFVREAPEELLQLEHWGYPGPRGRRPGRGPAVRWHEADAHVVRRRQDRLPHAARVVPDFAPVHALTRYDEWFVTRLLVDDGRVHGRRDRIAVRQRRTHPRAGRDPVHRRMRQGLPVHDECLHQDRRRDGTRLRAGAPLKDMEFVQYHPTGLPFTGILITEAARAEGGYLLNKDGYRYLQDYELEPAP